MNYLTFEALSRRASLVTLGAASVAGLAGPITADAKKNRKKKRKNGDVNKLCKKQVGQCIDEFNRLCQDDPDCLATIEECCAFFGQCNFSRFIICLELASVA